MDAAALHVVHARRELIGGSSSIDGDLLDAIADELEIVAVLASAGDKFCHRSLEIAGSFDRTDANANDSRTDSRYSAEHVARTEIGDRGADIAQDRARRILSVDEDVQREIRHAVTFSENSKVVKESVDK